MSNDFYDAIKKLSASPENKTFEFATKMFESIHRIEQVDEIIALWQALDLYGGIHCYDQKQDLILKKLKKAVVVHMSDMNSKMHNPRIHYILESIPK